MKSWWSGLTRINEHALEFKFTDGVPSLKKVGGSFSRRISQTSFIGSKPETFYKGKSNTKTKLFCKEQGDMSQQMIRLLKPTTQCEIKHAIWHKYNQMTLLAVIYRRNHINLHLCICCCEQRLSRSIPLAMLLMIAIHIHFVHPAHVHKTECNESMVLPCEMLPLKYIGLLGVNDISNSKTHQLQINSVIIHELPSPGMIQALRMHA